MFCPNCGKDNNGNKFCSNCGSVLNTTTNIIEKKEEEYKTVSLVLGIICLIMSFFASILCLIPGIISIVYAVKYKKECGKLGVGFGLSLGGIIFSVVVLISIIFLFICGMNAAVNMTDDYYNSIKDSYNYNSDVSDFY